MVFMGDVCLWAAGNHFCAFFKHGDENLILTTIQWIKMYGPHLMVNENSSNCCIAQAEQSIETSELLDNTTSLY